MADKTAKEKTPPTPLIYERLTSVMRDIGAIEKTQTNKFDNYQFRGIDDVYNSVQPALVEHGVTIVPTVLESELRQVQSSQGKPMNHAILRVGYRFYAHDGSHVTATVEGEGMDRGDKAVNKALSAAMKYMIFQTFCVRTGGLDADSESPEIGGAAGERVAAQVANGNPKHKKAAPATPAPSQAPSGGNDAGNVVTPSQVELVAIMCKKKTMSDDDKHALLEKTCGVKSTTAIPAARINDVLEAIKGWTPADTAVAGTDDSELPF